VLGEIFSFFFYANANILNVFNSMEGLLWSRLYGNWIYNYLCNQYLITTYVVSSNPAQARCMYLIQHYMIKFVSDLRHVSGLLRVLRFPPPMTTMIQWLVACQWFTLKKPKQLSLHCIETVNKIIITTFFWNSQYNSQQYFSYIMVVIGGGNLSSRSKPLTCRKSLTNFII
jgi:hypothetical protein